MVRTRSAVFAKAAYLACFERTRLCLDRLLSDVPA